MFTNKEKILHLFLTVIKQCTVLMDFSCEKLKSFTAGISLRFVYIHDVQPTFPGQGGLSVGKDLNIQVSYSVCIFEGNFRAWMSFF